MSSIANTVSPLWQDVTTAIENKKRDPVGFNRYYIGQIDDSPSAPVHQRKCPQRNLTERREDHFDLSAPLKGVMLTRREIQVLYLICRGATNREVASCLGLSPRTAEYYIKNMRKKALASSKLHLVDLVNQTDFLTRVDQTVLNDVFKGGML
ncbi:MAG: hypothetical protein A3F41_00440 [Coxiella sp. RIFCSPHIGHO2_12_FULL_44_14]|nr:MAG: hypothetical protein A3F41_00440 [Coxiella sp. RIFCSPHIGHO2_12_FULL_44_14]